jgi:hypothetical protein
MNSRNAIPKTMNGVNFLWVRPQISNPAQTVNEPKKIVRPNGMFIQ